eukprot:scaffold223_cov145-Amphora_coffeaeformis.AAC.5
MSDERQTKRARLEIQEKQEDDADEDDLQALLDGNGFVTEAKRAAEAERRRAQRRERLRRLADANADNEGSGKGRTTAAIKQEELPPPPRISPPIKQESDGETKPSILQRNNDQESGTESFDMFSSSPPPPQKGSNKQQQGKAAANHQSERGHGQQDWDDAEGYYNAVIGESIEVHDSATSDDPQSVLRFRVDGLIGRGVFSTVLKVTTLSNPTSLAIPPTVAVKMIRSNETMAKAATNEIRFLHQLRDSRGIIPLLLPTTLNPMEHRGHVMLVFPFSDYNMRDVLQKFGKGVGLSLPAVRSYFGQLLAALTHLKKHGIIHADLKPDNILVSGDFSTVHLADFGSAFEATAPENQPTPYLVSRFYRAPEIILGLTPTIAIDLWSLATSIAELFLGNVLFRGKSNNDMLYVFMQHLGAFSNRVIRQHVVQLSKLPTLARQFQTEGTNFVFLQQTVDPVTDNPIHKCLPLVTTSGSSDKFPLATPLSNKILRAKSATDARTDVQQFVDLLQKCLALDPTRRIALKDALGHEFFRPRKSGSE